MTEENKQELKPCPVLSDANNGVEISYVVKACIDCDLRKPGVGEDTINSCRGCESREKRVDKLVAEVERLKAEATVINGYAESVKEERDECYELEVKYKRLLGVAEKFLEEMVNVNGDYPYINKTDLVKDTYQILNQIKK